MTFNRSHAVVILLLGLPLSFAAAAESGDKAEQKQEVPAAKPADEPKVWTTEDLDRLARLPGTRPDQEPAGEPAPADPAAAPVPRPAESPGSAQGSEPGPASANEIRASEDPLAWLEAQKAQKTDRRAEIAEAEQRVAGLEARVRELETAIRATRNPLLKRPDIPEDRREEYRRMSTSERLATTQAELDQAQSELQTARAELSRLRSAS